MCKKSVRALRKFKLNPTREFLDSFQNCRANEHLKNLKEKHAEAIYSQNKCWSGKYQRKNNSTLLKYIHKNPKAVIANFLA